MFCALLLGGAAQACETAICMVRYSTLDLARLITFDDLASAPGPGRKVDDVLILPGARFGERFAGQTRSAAGDFDLIGGVANAPLTAIGGGVGETLGIKRLPDTTVLHGHGPRRFPARDAIGEGAIAVLFDHDQSALGFHLRGGEAGFATVMFLRRDGSLIQSFRLGPLGEDRFGFARADDLSDIAGFVLYNADPEGLAIDNLIFDAPERLSGHPPPVSPAG